MKWSGRGTSLLLSVVAIVGLMGSAVLATPLAADGAASGCGVGLARRSLRPGWTLQGEFAESVTRVGAHARPVLRTPRILLSGTTAPGSLPGRTMSTASLLSGCSSHIPCPCISPAVAFPVPG
jgi:hypothetical protein